MNEWWKLIDKYRKLSSIRVWGQPTMLGAEESSLIYFSGGGYVSGGYRRKPMIGNICKQSYALHILIDWSFRPPIACLNKKWIPDVNFSTHSAHKRTTQYKRDSSRQVIYTVARSFAQYVLKLMLVIHRSLKYINNKPIMRLTVHWWYTAHFEHIIDLFI